MASIQDEIIDIIAQEASIDREKITPDATMDDLSIESLDLVEIIFALEEKFDIAIPYNANDPGAVGADLDTVKDVVAAVEKLVGEKS